MRTRRRGADPQQIEFVEFVQQRSAALFRTAYVLTGSRETAEDLLQEALEKACRHWKRVVVADSPEAYVRRIVVNLANDRWRRLRRAGERAQLADPGDIADLHDRAGSPRHPDAYQLVELRDELVQALHALPIGMRTVVVLHYLHDLGDQEIADTLRISASAVRSQLARGLAKLRATAVRTASGTDAPPAAPHGHHSTPLPQFEGA